MAIKLKKQKNPTSTESSMADYHGHRLSDSTTDYFFMSQ